MPNMAGSYPGIRLGCVGFSGAIALPTNTLSIWICSVTTAIEYNESAHFYWV